MDRKLTFYKENNFEWYVDLPEWEEDKSALQMVMGADSMLDILAEGRDKVTLDISTEKRECHFKLKKTPKYAESGAYYVLPKYKGVYMNLEMWLCDVTKFVFGDFPKIIYINVIE